MYFYFFKYIFIFLIKSINILPVSANHHNIAMAGIPLSYFLPPPKSDLTYSLNAWGVRTETQIYTELREKFAAFAMSNHSRLGSECTWLSTVEPEVLRRIFDTLAAMTGYVRTSPCPISAIEERIRHWQLKYYTSNFKIQTWAQLIELQRVLNWRWKQGGVSFQMPPAEVLDQHKDEWWNVMSWLGWTSMRVLDLSSLHDDLVAMVHANPGLWNAKPPHAVFNLLQRLCIKYKGFKYTNDEIYSITYKLLVRYEEWNYETPHTSVSFPQIHISNEQ